MKRHRRKEKKGAYRMAAVLAVFCMLGNGARLLGAPASDGERLTAGVGQILDSVPEEDQEEEESGERMDDKRLQDGMAGEAEAENAAGINGKETGEKMAGEEPEDSQTEAVSKSADEPGTEVESAFEEQLVMTAVTDVLNVRSEPSEDAERVGYLYADCGGTILERRNGWTKLESGELVGWAKDEYLLFGEKAVEELEDVGRLVAHVTGETLRIRKEPSMEAQVYDLAAQGDALEVVNKAQLHYSDGIELDAEWAAVDYEGQTGYVSAEYIEIDFEYDHGETLEEIAARQQIEKKEMTQGASADKKMQSSPDRQNAGGIPEGTGDATLLAALIQCEAGSESYEGQLAVGAVVVNRVKSASYPNTVSDVIFASGQFTPAGSGKVARVIENGTISSSCMQAAREALSGVTNVGSATHFRRAGGRDGIVIGNHVFW
ncbi:MAG TPA: cell wall hydrolase [Candidatus Eisenbergiella stercoravium]|nr:cell wall hydrolase [Candidatus Eisenbergiella stercoravium]